MKHFFVAVYALLLMFSLAACNTNSDTSQSTSPAESVSKEMPPEEFADNAPDEAADSTQVDAPAIHSSAEATDNTPTAAIAGNSPAEPADSTQTDTLPAEQPATGAPANEANTKDTTEESITQMNVQVGDVTFTATLADTAAAEAFAAMLQNAPVSIPMQDYGGFEKVGALGMTLPASDYPTTAQSGDIVLYNSNQIVIFYGSNSWSYTRLGRIADLTNWSNALGNGDVTVTFSL